MLPGFASLRMGVPLGGKPPFLLWERGMLYLAVVFCLPGWGQNRFFFCTAKEKSGSGLRKRKDRPVEMITGDGTTGRWCCAVMVSLG